MKEDINEALTIVAFIIAIGILFLLTICAIIGIPTYAIIEIIKAIKQ